MRHANISIFIPHLGCPFQCIFCDQHSITGKSKPIPANEIGQYIKEAVDKIDFTNTDCQIAFFGGSFTAIDRDEMENYLKAAYPFTGPGKCSGIRISTRPDFIDNDILEILKKYNVRTIELGAQSLDNNVLIKSGRGHTAFDTQNAAQLIISNGFELGLQMMVGLPGSDFDAEMYTAKKIIELKASQVRIYPVIVFAGTKLYKMYQNKEYTPLSLETAVNRCAKLFNIFRQNNVTILKIGLHDANKAACGPFHPAFGQMVRSRAFLEQLMSELGNAKSIKVLVNGKFLSTAIGNNKQNVKELKAVGIEAVFEADNTILGDTYKIEII